LHGRSSAERAIVLRDEIPEARIKKLNIKEGISCSIERNEFSNSSQITQVNAVLFSTLAVLMLEVNRKRMKEHPAKFV